MSDHYPMLALRRYMRDKSNDKFHSFTLILAPFDKAVLVHQWGSNKHSTQTDVRTFDRHGTARKAYETGGRMKSGHGFTGHEVEIDIESRGDLVPQLGLMFFNTMGGKAVNHLDPEFNTSRMKKEPDLPRFDENFRRTKEETRKADLSAAIAEAEQQAAEEQRVAYQNHATWGMF